ncbi:MAG: TRAP transporter substrate-binding protein DctP [Chloroflexi bacterium]|nr:TRAP transporter substrate-binding protein DctP [Chloroflexota bacterium]
MCSSRITYVLALLAIGLGLAACAGAAPTPTGPTTPQKTITMKFASALSESDQQMIGVLGYLKEVEQRTQKTSTAVKFEYFNSGQLYNATQIPRAVSEGAIETGLTYTSTMGDQLSPAFTIAIIPLIWDDEYHLQRAIDGEVGQILEAELEKFNMKALFWNQIPAWEWFGRQKPIVRPADVKGMTLRSSGGHMDRFYEVIGAVGVNVPSGEQYSAFQRGVADGAALDIGATQSRKLYEVLKYGTRGAKLMVAANPTAMNIDVWKSLPKDTQDAFLAVKKELQPREADRISSAYDSIIKDFEANGMQITAISEADRKAWYDYKPAMEEAFLKAAGDLGRKLLDASAKYRK